MISCNTAPLRSRQVFSVRPDLLSSISLLPPGRQKPVKRKAAILVEALVAATILMVGVLVVAKSSASLRSMWKETRHYQLACDELANQLQHLKTLSVVEVEQQLKTLSVSKQIVQALPEATLQGELLQDKLGNRVRLSITWKRLGQAVPLSLVGWLHATDPIRTIEAVTAKSDDHPTHLQARNKP
jgi:hypothetical protein